MHDVRLAVLGPVRVVRDGHRVDVGGPRQRAVLALLAIARGDLVPAERLVDPGAGAPSPRFDQQTRAGGVE